MHLVLVAVLCAQVPTIGEAIGEAVGPPPESQSVQAETVNPLIEKLHTLAQTHRERSGRPAQVIDAELNSLAQRHADWMAANYSMTHGGGENIIAMGQRTPEEAINTWINSSGHNYWLLSNTSRAGWGAARAKNGTWFWAGAFRNDRKPVVKAAQAVKTVATAPARFVRNRIGRRR